MPEVKKQIPVRTENLYLVSKEESFMLSISVGTRSAGVVRSKTKLGSKVKGGGNLGDDPSSTRSKAG